MGMIRSLIRGLQALRSRNRRNGEIEDELLAFMEEAIADRMRDGMTREKAERAARAEIGSVNAVQHMVWSGGWESHAERLWRDLLYTLRRLTRTPGLVFAVILSIGLGIAANTTIFSLVSKFVLAPAPVGDPATLTTVYRTYDNGACCNELPMAVYRDLRDQAKSFSGMAAYYELVPASLGGEGEPERVWGQATTANYFDVAQLRMELGRGFASTEENIPVVVLGYQLWQHHFNGDPAIVNKTVTLGGLLYTVVGVAPKGFRGLDLILDPQFWVPLGNLAQMTANAPDPGSRTMQWLRVSARLRPGVTRAQAAAEMQSLGLRFAALHPETDKGDNFHLEPAGSLPPRDKKSIQVFLAVLSIVAFLVLCIACANVANLLLAQGARRQREMAVRLSLGATRAQLIRQLLLESTLLSLGGGLLGILLSLWATRALSSFRLPAPMPLDLGVAVEARTALYTLCLSLTAGFLCGFVPAWIASRPVLANALKGEESLARPGRLWSLRDILVVVQISLSLVLLCGSGLFLRSLERASRIDPGFRSGGVLLLAVDPPSRTYTATKTIQLLHLVRQQILGLPGVIDATVTDGVPLSGGHRSDGFVVEGSPASTEASTVDMYMAGPAYFATLGIPRVAGREFEVEDPAAPKVTIVNEELVRRFFLGQNPIGRRIVDGGVPYQIVGVVKNTKSRSIGEEQRPIMYRSIDQSIEKDPSGDGYQFIVHYRGDPGFLIESVRREIRAQDANLAVFHVRSLQEHLEDALFLPRFIGTIFTVFGSMGVVLASVGLYGVVSYAVSQRTKEIGIRMAMGARADEVQKLFVREGARLSLVSLGLGLPVALAGARLAMSVLYGVPPYDPATFTVVPVLLFVITLGACWIPARRASRVDPMVALRVD